MPQAVQVEYLVSGIMHSGEPLASGQVYFYETDGTTAKTIWNDANKSSTASNPVTLDSNGKGEIFADGTYTVLIKTSAGSTIQTLENQYFFPNSGTVTTSEIDASSFGAATNATISTAVTSASGEDRTVYLNPGNWAISDNLTIPSNINLKFLMGAYVTVANTKTITISGSIEAPLYNIFRGEGSVVYDDRTNIVPSIWPIGGSHDNLTLDGTVTIKDNLIVNGTTTTINSTVVTIDDPIFTLGGDTAPSSDDNKDRGIEFRYHTGSAAKVGFFGYDDSTQKFSFLVDATNSSETFSGTTGTILANLEGNVTGDVTGTATNATHVTVTDNESTDEDNLITFVEDATSSTGNVGLEMDGNLTYNPSTGRLTATQLSGTLQTAAQANITSVGTLSSLTVSGDATFDTSTLKVDSSNNRVGIGTASPNVTLEVEGVFKIGDSGSYKKLNFSSGSASSPYEGIFEITPGTIPGSGTSQMLTHFKTASNVGSTRHDIAIDGLVGIGDLTPDVSCDVVGDINYTGTISDVSDRRLKENIISIENSLEKICQLAPVKYTMVAERNNEKTKEEYGFIAQDVKPVFPEIVTDIEKVKDKESGETISYLGVAYIQLISPIIGAIKELKSEVDALKNG